MNPIYSFLKCTGFINYSILFYSINLLLHVKERMKGINSETQAPGEKVELEPVHQAEINRSISKG